MTNHGIIYDSYWSDGFRGIAERKYFDYCPVVFQLAKRISDTFYSWQTIDLIGVVFTR